MPFVANWNIWWTKDGLFKEKTLSFLQLVTKPLYSRSKFSSKHQRCGGKTNVVMYVAAKQEKPIFGYIYVACMDQLIRNRLQNYFVILYL